MRYVVYGLIIGILLGISPVFVTHTGFVLTPLWYGSLQHIQRIEPAADCKLKSSFAVSTDSGYYLLNASGSVLRFITSGDSFIKPTCDGNFYIMYKKVGNEIALYNANNEFFWKLPSTEYPYISPNGSVIVLLTADGSSARIADFNGNVYTNPELNGQFTTALAFSQNGSFAGIGFIDGRFYIVNSKGQTIFKGTSPQSTVIKGIAIDDNGNFSIVHCGNSSKDFLLCINIQKQKSWQHELFTCHLVKTSIAINRAGKAMFCDIDSLLEIDIKGKDIYTHPVAPKRYGHSQISVDKDIFVLTYPTASGGSMWYIWQWGKGKIYSREFVEEPYLHNSLSDSVILLRGQDTLACFAYRE